MEWVEIITLRSSGKINRQFVDELLERVPDCESPTDTPRLVEVRAYYHSVVETDFSIHIRWESEPGRQDKSPLGLRLSTALRNLGLLNHSVWLETKSAEFPSHGGDAKSRDGIALVGPKARNAREGG